MRIDLFAHFTTQEFRQAYLSIPLGAKGRRQDSLAIRTFVQAQRTTDIDVLWDMEQRLRVLDRYGIDLQVLTLCFPMVGGLEPEEELRLARLANDGLAEIVQRHPQRFLGVATLPFSSPAERPCANLIAAWIASGLRAFRSAQMSTACCSTRPSCSPSTNAPPSVVCPCGSILPHQ